MHLVYTLDVFLSTPRTWHTTSNSKYRANKKP